MKKLFLLSVLLFAVLIFKAQQNNSKIIKDSLLGKPKYVKEYVVFLSDSGPYTFMSGDSEYGHAIIMEPDNLRESMRASWFGSSFCRYTNNEAFYNENGTIAKEIWYYRSGRVIGDYDYLRDSLGRLVSKRVKNKNYHTTDLYFYNGSGNKVTFIESFLKWKDEPIKKYINRYNHNEFLTVTKFDTLSRTDSIFAVTDFVWNKVGERSFQEGKDSIFRKKLSRVDLYDNNFQIRESKFFDYKLDHYNKKLFQSRYAKYERDSLGRIIKETEIQDDKYHYFVLEQNGKYREEIKEGGHASISSIIFEYYNDGTIKTRTHLYQGNISDQIQFVYKNNQIEKLFYLDTWGKNKNDLKPTEVIFKYKFDKQKNWTEIIKNVNGKDKYKWVREIEYYK